MVSALALRSRMETALSDNDQSISDDQALALAAAFHRLMEFEIAVRSNQYDDIEPDQITLTIALLIKVFSHTHINLEKLFETANFRKNAFERMEILQAQLSSTAAVRDN